MLTNRLKEVHCKVISQKQSTFLPKRNILDGVLIVNENIDLAKRTNDPCLLLKVDFEKACDLVSWSYFEYMMNRLGFCATCG